MCSISSLFVETCTRKVIFVFYNISVLESVLKTHVAKGDHLLGLFDCLITRCLDVIPYYDISSEHISLTLNILISVTVSRIYNCYVQSLIPGLQLSKRTK